MTHRTVDCDNVREGFSSTGTAIYLDGALPTARGFVSAGFVTADTFYGCARSRDNSGEIVVGKFTFTSGTPNSVAQTEVWYSSNGNAAVSFSSGSKEIFIDSPARLFDELNLAAITVASAATCDIGAAQAGKVIVSGAVTITSLGTTAHKRRFVHFSGALTLTHNVTSLILPGARNIITAAGDTAVFLSDSSGNWRCYDYQRAAGLPAVAVRVQKFTSSGTYTPDPNLLYAIIECIGGGGGGGGVAGFSTSSTVVAGGGGSGGYSRLYATAATIGASKAVTIGAAGAGGTAGFNPGGAGGTTSVGSLCTASGGSGASGSSGNGGGGGAPGAGGAAGTGDVTAAGNPGMAGLASTINTINPGGGCGGSSVLGGGAVGQASNANAAGIAAGNYGSGGGGAAANSTVSNFAGGAGSAGIAIITEFCSA